MSSNHDISFVIHYIYVGDTAKTKISRMIYTNFDDAITDKHGVVVEGWPPGIKFCSPSDIKTRNEVKVLFHAWESGTAKFRLMSTAEWKAWSDNRFDALNTPPIIDSPSDNTPNGGAPIDAPPDDKTQASGDSPSNAAPDGAALSGQTSNQQIPTTCSNDDRQVPNAPVSPPEALAPPSSNKRSANAPSSAPPPKQWGLTKLNNFVNTTAVTNTDGVAIVTERRQRKPRKDKGTKRGPNKRSAAD